MSSSSLAAVANTRNCIRLTEPDPRTVEQYVGSALVITIFIPYEKILKYAAAIPNAGPDTLTINYTDPQGQAVQMYRQATLWMSDSGYVFLSVDRGAQFLLAGFDGAFFDTNAAIVNARNVTAGSIALLPCASAGRYGAPALEINGVRPTVFIRDGVAVT